MSYPHPHLKGSSTDPTSHLTWQTTKPAHESDKERLNFPTEIPIYPPPKGNMPQEALARHCYPMTIKAATVEALLLGCTMGECLPDAVGSVL